MPTKQQKNSSTFTIPYTNIPIIMAGFVLTLTRLPVISTYNETRWINHTALDNVQTCLHEERKWNYPTEYPTKLNHNLPSCAQVHGSETRVECSITVISRRVNFIANVYRIPTTVDIIGGKYSKNRLREFNVPTDTEQGVYSRNKEETRQSPMDYDRFMDIAQAGHISACSNSILVSASRKRKLHDSLCNYGLLVCNFCVALTDSTRNRCSRRFVPVLLTSVRATASRTYN